MKVQTRHLFSVAIGVTLLLLPSRVWACACCAHPGEYQIDFVKPDEFKLSVIKRIRFGTKAELWTGEADPEVAAEGLAHPADSYSLTGSLVGNVWKLTFRNGDESGTLDLPVPAKMLRFAADPKRWISVTAPVWASARWSPACWIRNADMTRWTICKTGESSWG